MTRCSIAVAAACRRTVFGAALLAAAAMSAQAQRTDSARVGAARAATDTTARPVPTPPLSPRRAFLYSLLLPGYSQSILGRPTAGAIFVVSESIALAMLQAIYGINLK